VSSLAALTAPDELPGEIVDQILMPLVHLMHLPAASQRD
jgi:hypothetical protein